MKLTIVSPGDPSVGIMPTYYSIDAPYNIEDVTEEDQVYMDAFLDLMVKTYSQHLDEKCYGYYDHLQL